MEISELDDSVFDFFNDEQKRGSYKRERRYRPYQHTEQVANSSEYEYEDDFETTPSDGDEKRLQFKVESDISTNYVSITEGSPDKEYIHDVFKMSQVNVFCDDVSSSDKSKFSTCQFTKEDTSRRRSDRTSRRHGKTSEKKKAVQKRIDWQKHTNLTVSSSQYDSGSDVGPRKRDQNGITSKYPDSYFEDFEGSIVFESTSDAFSDVVLKNDRFSNAVSSNCFSSNKSKTMSNKNRVSLPHVDKSRRIQLTRKSSDKRRIPIGNKEQHRNHASGVSREIAGQTASRKPDKKPSIPIPLESQAIYCDGELSVSVRGDKRGNPNKNKFNVTITVIHKHLKSHPIPYLSRHSTVHRGRWRRDEPDLDIIKHRAVLPGFNTAMDPEVNKRYLRQFGI